MTISSMIRPAIMSAVSAAVRGALVSTQDSAPRYFSTLDPALSSKYAIATPVTLSDEFKICLKFATSSSVTTNLISSSSGSDWIEFQGGTGIIRVRVMGGLRMVFTGCPDLSDGKLHSLDVVRIPGDTFEIIVDGITYPESTGNVQTGSFSGLEFIGSYVGSTEFFDGIISDVKLVSDSSGTPTTTTFNLNLASGAGNTENSVEGGNSVTYVNIPDGNRKLYTQTGGDWVSGGVTLEVA